MIIFNNECDYIMKNIKAVNALLETYVLTKETVPTWLSKQLKKSIEKRINEFTLNEESKWVVEGDKEEVSIYPNNYYNDNHDFGLFYGIQSLNWDCLAAENQEDSMWIYLFYEKPEKSPKGMREKINDWETELIRLTNKFKPSLLEKYHVMPQEGFLVTYYLNEVLNLETLANDPENAINKTVDIMIQFVKDTQDLLISI